MAIDSREKRFSMLNFGDGAHLHAIFEADGSVDLDDRQHLLDCYSGIAFAAPTSNINTRHKRFSMLNFGDGNHWHATFEADGAVDLDDRQHLLDCYSGIAFGAPVAAAVKQHPRGLFRGVGGYSYP